MRASIFICGVVIGYCLGQMVKSKADALPASEDVVFSSGWYELTMPGYQWDGANKMWRPV